MILQKKSGLMLSRIYIRIFQRIRLLLFYPIRRWQFLSFGAKSNIFTPNCKIVNRKHISIGDRTVIGKFARIEPVCVYAGKKYNPLIEIGNEVCINQNFHCTCAQSIIIGDGTSITANCGIFDIIHPYENIHLNPRLAQIKVEPVKIGRDCLIGMNSEILPGTNLGDHCVVGANSVVSGTWPERTVLVGSPAKAIKRYNPMTSLWERTPANGSPK